MSRLSMALIRLRIDAVHRDPRHAAGGPVGSPLERSSPMAKPVPITGPPVAGPPRVPAEGRGAARLALVERDHPSRPAAAALAALTAKMQVPRSGVRRWPGRSITCDDGAAWSRANR
jgi:hypothetical protein